MLNRRAIIHLCAILTFLPLSTSWATQTENHGIHAVPAPGPVIIDGSLDDWDLSGQTLMTYDIENLRDLYSGQVALMYDATNLYASIHWKDPHPMTNHHDPHYQGGKGWAADCVQLRFKTDRVAHVTAWLYSDRQEPAINISYGSEGDPFKGPSIMLYRTEGWHLTDGAEMAFKKDPDGKGYVQEIKLPWKLLTDTRTYLPGGSLNMGVELLWGTTDWPDQRYADNLMPGKSSREFFWQAVNDWGPVTLEPQGHLHLPTPDYMTKALHPAAEAQGPIALRYNLPRDGRVSLVIDDANGNRIRNLVPALPRNKGVNVEHWDGLDDAGKSVPPGDYVYRVLYHDPIHVNYAMSFANPGNPTWPTSDGRGAFYGDHSSPHAVAAGGDYVGLACPIGEAGQPLIGCNLDGQRLWGQANRVFAGAGITSLATDGKTLWVASDGDTATIYRVNIANGLYAPWNQESTDEQGQNYKVLDLTVSAAPGPKEQKGAAATAPAGPNLTAIAVRGNVLALCLAHENKIKLLDAEAGVVQKELVVDNPRSVAIDTDGSILALSGGKILRLTPDGKSVPFATGSYPDAYGLAVDRLRNVYLSVRGVDQNVKVFRPDGSLLREIGKRGGRPSLGLYDPNGMLNPAQIAVDSRGRLWVTEENDNPKRTSIWDTQTGRLVKDLPGTTHYAAAGALDPSDPTLGFNDNTVYKLDWTKGSFQPIYSLAAQHDPNDLFPA
ncbi:MAG: hypothetical protein M3Y56_05895, partial [Armatimonadota bacterium]|nr:hypothetical protein [Armatimonadota bacterium]